MPIGYVGPVPRETVRPASSMPPIGYVGPVARADGNARPLPGRGVDVAPSLRAPVLPSSEVLSTDDGADHSDETLVAAQEMHSDSEAGIVTAVGKVEVVHKDHILHADKVIYNQKTGVMRAEGHVALLTPSGEVEFASYQEITGDMKQAFARKVGILFPDNSRMAANTVQRYDERYSVADHGMYTACNVCHENPDEKPLWQVGAKTITHDNADHRIYYHDATVEFAGVPVVYTPYMSGPDPTVKRLQGFLSPVPGYSPNIGNYLKTPYYFDLAPEADMTVTPIFSTEDTLQLGVQYRQRFERGKLLLDGSGTYADLINDEGVDKGKEWRGHVFGNFLSNIDNIWRLGSDIQFVSDKSYLPRYKISSLDQTTSRLYLEGFKGRNYAVVNSYYFQDLRVGSHGAEPFVLPSASFSALGDPGETWGGRWSFDGSTLVTARNNSGLSLAQQGPDTRRLSLNGGWERQFISSTGLETTISGLLRTDSYWASNVVNADNTAVYDKALFTRGFGQANVVARYPVGRSGDGYQQLLEPIVALTAAPEVRSISKLPVEDSLDIEFDETNLFSPNRFTGNDLIEDGSRATYGLRHAITADNGARIDMFGGESYSFSPNSRFSEMSGLSGHASDYVGRIDLSPASWMEANYGFRLAKDDFSPRRQDVYFSVGAPIFRPWARYIQAYQLDTTTNLYDEVQQATLGLSSRFAKYWNFTASHTQSFEPDPGPRKTSVAITYVDECFAFGINLSQDHTNRLDVSSGTSVAFHFYLKNLGGLHTDTASGVRFPAEFRQTDP